MIPALLARLAAYGSPAVIAAVKQALALGVVRHSSGKLIATAAGRYLARTIGLRATGMALSGPLSLVIGLAMLGYDVSKLLRT